MLDRISSAVAAAVPNLPTATPAAWLARMAASPIDASAAAPADSNTTAKAAKKARVGDWFDEAMG